LDGVTTVSGLDHGTHYFWVELIDTSGNTGGPQPAGSYTTPTVWELYVLAMTNTWKPHLYAIESSFGVTPENLVMDNGWVHDIPGSPDLGSEVSVTNGVQWTNRLANMDARNGSKLWTITDETRSESPVFTVTWRKQLHTPGVEISKNGVMVYSETENGGSGQTPEENVETCSL
jgi:hypothetical protein